MISFSSFSLSFPIFSVKKDNVIVSCTPVQSHIRPYLFWNDIFFCTYTDNLSQWKVAVDSNILSVTVSVFLFFLCCFFLCYLGTRKKTRNSYCGQLLQRWSQAGVFVPFGNETFSEKRFGNQWVSFPAFTFRVQIKVEVNCLSWLIKLLIIYLITWLIFHLRKYPNSLEETVNKS